MKKSLFTFLKPVIVLALVCLVCTLALAVTNLFTAPLIADAEAKAEQDALSQVCEGATKFDEMDLSTYEGISKTVTKVYSTDVTNAYVFRLEASGYASGIRILCAIKDGQIIGISTLSSNETDGYGKACENASYYNQYIGKNDALDGVDAITGATKTTNGYQNAIRSAFDAYEILTGGSN